jgi:hypothetical protein
MTAAGTGAAGCAPRRARGARRCGVTPPGRCSGVGALPARPPRVPDAATGEADNTAASAGPPRWLRRLISWERPARRDSGSPCTKGTRWTSTTLNRHGHADVACPPGPLFLPQWQP